jgi:hypothetical protein
LRHRVEAFLDSPEGVRLPFRDGWTERFVDLPLNGDCHEAASASR